MKEEDKKALQDLKEALVNLGKLAFVGVIFLFVFFFLCVFLGILI